MVEIYINEGTLTDKSKVYDVVLRDFDQGEGEDCLRINCIDKRAAELLAQTLEHILSVCH